MRYFDVVTTLDGEARVLTKKRFFKDSHTSLMPADFRRLGQLGVIFYWSTSNPTILKTLHDSVVQSLRKSSLADIRHALDTRGPDIPLAEFALLMTTFHPPVTKYIKRIWTW